MTIKCLLGASRAAVYRNPRSGSHRHSFCRAIHTGKSGSVRRSLGEARPAAAYADETSLSPIQLREIHRNGAAIHSFILKGVSFGGRQTNLESIKLGDAVVLEKEPENEHDSHAVAVKLLNGNMLGYVPKEINQSPFFRKSVDFGHVRSVGIGADSGLFGARVEQQPSLLPLVAEAIPRELVNLSKSIASERLKAVGPHQTWCQLTGSRAERAEPSLVWRTEPKFRKIILTNVAYLAPQLRQAQELLLADGPIDQEAAFVFQAMNGWTFDEVASYRRRQQEIVSQRNTEGWSLAVEWLAAERES